MILENVNNKVGELVGNGYTTKDKNKAKRTKLSTGLEKYEKLKLKAYTSLNGLTRTHLMGRRSWKQSKGGLKIEIESRAWIEDWDAPLEDLEASLTHYK
ncbi:hypothetical protein Tco_0524811 [Tanacetum coccineum]